MEIVPASVARRYTPGSSRSYCCRTSVSNCDAAAPRFNVGRVLFQGIGGPIGKSWRKATATCRSATSTAATVEGQAQLRGAYNPSSRPIDGRTANDGMGGLARIYLGAGATPDRGPTVV